MSTLVGEVQLGNNHLKASTNDDYLSPNNDNKPKNRSSRKQINVNIDLVEMLENASAEMQQKSGSSPNTIWKITSKPDNQKKEMSPKKIEAISEVDEESLRQSKSVKPDKFKQLVINVEED